MLKKICNPIFVFFFLSCFLGFVPKPFAADLKFQGYAETRYSYLGGVDLGDLCEGTFKEALKTACDPHSLFTRIRPSFLFDFGANAKVRVTANFQTTHFRLEKEITKIDDMLSLQRLYFDYRTKFADFRLGLQPIQWGPSMLWNLTIPFVPQDPTDANAEQPGIWAITSYISYSSTGGFRLGIMAAPDFKSSIEFLRWKHTFGTTEIGITALRNGMQKKMILGAEIKGNFTIGYWLESAVYIPYEGENMDVTFSVIAGIDYSFPVLEKLYFLLQYYYNHAGISDPAKYPFKDPSQLLQLAQQFQKTDQGNNITGVGLGNSYMGAHYLLFSAQLTVIEDLSVSLMAVGNLLDPSFLLGTFVAYTFLDNFTIQLGFYGMVGPDGSEFQMGKIQIPIPGAPSDGVKIAPSFAAFGWLRYNF